jgi:cytochrome o ubiquinol oxidase subunit II
VARADIRVFDPSRERPSMSLFKSKRILRLLIFSILACALPACAPTSSFLTPAGPIADAQRKLFFDIVYLMLIVVVPVLLLVPLFAWRYRHSNRSAQYRPEWAFSWPLEFLIWGIPCVIVAIMSVLIVTRESPLDPYAPLPSKSGEPPLQVQVIGLDWKWLFIYPQQHIATVGVLGLPVGQPVRFHLTSDTVMQSFFIPALGSQIYAMAGMVTKLNLRADRFRPMVGRNTQFNGDGFHLERFTVAAMSLQDFSAWVGEVRAHGRPLDASTYGQLAARSTAQQAHDQLAMTGTPKSVLYFSKVSPDFFDGVVGKYRQIATSNRDNENR